MDGGEREAAEEKRRRQSKYGERIYILSFAQTPEAGAMLSCCRTPAVPPGGQQMALCKTPAAPLPEEEPLKREWRCSSGPSLAAAVAPHLE